MRYERSDGKVRPIIYSYRETEDGPVAVVKVWDFDRGTYQTYDEMDVEIDPTTLTYYSAAERDAIMDWLWG